MGPNNQQLPTTHDLSDVNKTIFKIKKKPCTQIGCVPIIGQKTETTQTEDHTSAACTNEDHLIFLRQNYIRNDAIRILQIGYIEPITSHKNRHRMPTPSTTAYQKWASKLKGETKP